MRPARLTFPWNLTKGMEGSCMLPSNTTLTCMMSPASSTLYPTTKTYLPNYWQRSTGPWANWKCLLHRRGQRILFDWNDHTVDFPQVCIHDLVSEQVEKNRDAIAVECNGKSLTYDELRIKVKPIRKLLGSLGNYAGRPDRYLPATI